MIVLKLLIFVLVVLMIYSVFMLILTTTLDEIQSRREMRKTEEKIDRLERRLGYK